MKILEGRALVSPGEYGVVVSRFNDLVTRRLLDGAIDLFRRHGGDPASLTVAWVPGSFELPLAAQGLAKTGRFRAIVCLGAVIQGQTTHHEYINQQVAAGLQQVALENHLPVTFGVLTCENMEQALDRAGGKVGNKGHEAMLAAIEMVQLLSGMAPGA
ncbi:MAG: 6,7-dimethyl-8-ribityllumazine synthase [Planctomycetaceae bacterium]|jgi:6,7-dimethyl-8-ribityllumazine synthase